MPGRGPAAQLLVSIFAPEGWPSSVAPEYGRYQLWDTIQQVRHALSHAVSLGVVDDDEQEEEEEEEEEELPGLITWSSMIKYDGSHAMKISLKHLTTVIALVGQPAGGHEISRRGKSRPNPCASDRIGNGKRTVDLCWAVPVGPRWSPVLPTGSNSVQRDLRMATGPPWKTIDEG
eukprot:Skav229050  [mRNA]  locus=scaffold2828:96108:97314:+ [translate_table: standard]